MFLLVKKLGKVCSLSSVIASIISSGIDEIFNRAGSVGAFTPLNDALDGLLLGQA
jgi:hypothetical protein